MSFNYLTFKSNNKSQKIVTSSNIKMMYSKTTLKIKISDTKVSCLFQSAFFDILISVLFSDRSQFSVVYYK